MKLINRQGPLPRRLGILAGSYNPPTCAHLALAKAGLEAVDEVLFVLPAVFPHKQYEGASFEQRLEMLTKAAEDEPRFSIGVAEGGLFIEIARETREHYPGAALFFLCGRDAAERIVTWDYGEKAAIEGMLEVFQLLVAPRQGVFVPPSHLAHAVHALRLSDYDECSATRVREAAGAGEEWEPLVPAAILGMVREIYG